METGLIPHALPAALAIVLAPLLPGVVNRTKAMFAGRTGPPLLQTWYDIAKLLRKGAVYSTTATWLFRAGPAVGLAALLAALLLVPAGGLGAPLRFGGDVVLFAYLLALARFGCILAALDTGSAFEGMGASREAQFSALAEPALFLGVAALARQSGELSLSGMYAALDPATWGRAFPALCLIAVSLFVVLLSENSRMPVDDPGTHLELTMIHEVMVLDHGGPDLAFITYAAALKLWVLGALVVGLLVPVRTENFALDLGAFLTGMAALGVAIGVVESVLARFSLLRVPKFLGSAAVLAALAFLLVPRV
ncbi:MAG: NADH-quinone oxidoreductase subunit H [Candidatus Sericytochromatia bacterium]|nr:NADH-quinone oxidoreductase subunit H [Candidatus Tanganyikabacteria bacterium]